MIPRLIVFSWLLLAPISSFAQYDSIIQPNVEINVNKEYDEEGNLIRFDSSYATSWSSAGAISQDILKQLETLFGGLDSASMSGQPLIGTGFPFDPTSDFESLFNMDFNAMFEEMEDPILEMDSIFMQLNPNMVSPFSGEFGQYFREQLQLQQKMLEQLYGPPPPPLAPPTSTPQEEEGTKI